MEYLGQVRAMSERRTEFVSDYWGKMRGRPDIADLFRHEVLCKEGEPADWVFLVNEFLVLEAGDPG